MSRERYCLYYDNYVKVLPEHETEECIDYPHGCDPQDCEFCRDHHFDEEGNRID